MFNSLFEFYRSKEWRALVEVVKLDRVNDEGELTCEYCGKPITKAYDAICHHKEELTEDNVNDYSISLNPDNIAILHHRCHNYTHNKLGYRVREVFLVYGPPLAGKHEWVMENMAEGDLVVDMDDIWQCISCQDRYVKPNRLKALAFMVRDALIDAVKVRYGKWNNAYIVGGYPLRSERERLCKELGAREVFVDATRAECVDQLETLSDILNKDEWIGYIDEWFDRFTPPQEA